MKADTTDTAAANGMPDGTSAATLALVLTNPHREDDPIVYVNDAFGRITGYAPAATAGAGSGGKGLGGRIVLSLVRGLDARPDTVGTTVTVDIPRDEGSE